MPEKNNQAGSSDFTELNREQDERLKKKHRGTQKIKNSESTNLRDLLEDFADEHITDENKIIEEQSLQFIVFRVKDCWFAFEDKYVAEVIKVSNVSPFPLMPDYYKGVIAFRGEVLPLIELSSIFTLINEPADVIFNLSRRAVVVTYNKMIAVFNSDYLEGIVNQHPKDFLDKDQIDVRCQELCKGVFVDDNNLINIIDVEKLFQKTKV